MVADTFRGVTALTVTIKDWKGNKNFARNILNVVNFSVRFRLDDNGDVIWTVPEELKSIPLFSCETYEIYSTTISGAVLRFGAYAGHVLEFRVFP